MKEMSKNVDISNYFLEHRSGINNSNDNRLFMLSLAYLRSTGQDIEGKIISILTTEEYVAFTKSTVKHAQLSFRNSKDLKHNLVLWEDECYKHVYEDIIYQDNKLIFVWNKDILHHFNYAI